VGKYYLKLFHKQPVLELDICDKLLRIENDAECTDNVKYYLNLFFPDMYVNGKVYVSHVIETTRNNHFQICLDSFLECLHGQIASKGLENWCISMTKLLNFIHVHLDWFRSPSMANIESAMYKKIVEFEDEPSFKETLIYWKNLIFPAGYVFCAKCYKRECECDTFDKSQVSII
jgi:hypothetical protein